MKRVHHIAGIIITAFIVLHLCNHLYSLAGPEKHIEMMHAFRRIYRNIFAETILLASIAVQVFSGIQLFRAKRKTVNTGFEKLQVWTGLYLAFFLLIHLSAVLGARHILHMDTNFYFGVAGLNTFPYNLFFIPYYGLAVIAFFGHIAAIHSKKMKRPVLGCSPATQAKIIIAVGIIITLLLFYGFTNGGKGVEIPGDYQLPALIN